MCDESGEMTSIQWTDETWNPVRGCSVVSEGCRNCYAMKQAHRFSGKGRPYEGLTKRGPQGPVWTGQIRTVPEVLAAPLHWRKPKKIFVNSMSDLFHEDVPDDFIKLVLRVICAAPQHTFQVLTKRPERMRRFMAGTKHCDFLGDSWGRRVRRDYKLPDEVLGTRITSLRSENLWLGVSIEDQKTADERIPILLQTPAAVQFLSIEPLLGHISLDQALPFKKIGGGPASYQDWPDWVILGGESGPDARPCDIAWFRSIVEECRAASVPCFVKQLGAKPMVADDCSSLLRLTNKKGGDPAEWPADLRVREWPR